MTTSIEPAVDRSVAPAGRQLSTEPTDSRAWWFLGTLAVLRNPEGAARTPVVMELTIPPGGSPPRHVHESLDDSFLLLDGEVVIRCGEQTVVARPGTYVVLPAGVEHTFRVTSEEPARMLLVHADDSFLGLVEKVGTPTTVRRLPPPGEFDLDMDTLVRLNAEHGSPLVGPSLEEDEARQFAPRAEQPALGAVNHLEITVSDLRVSEKWYAEAFGLLRVQGEVNDDGTGHVVLLSPTGGWMLALAGGAAPDVGHVAVTCRSRDALLRWQQVLSDRGVRPGTITDAPYGSGFVVRDPDGIELELFAAAPA